MALYGELEATYNYLARELEKRNIAYIHIMDQKSRGSFALPGGYLARFRKAYNGVLILTGGMDKEKSNQYIGTALIDLAGFGEPFIANPDLTARLQNNWPLSEPDRNSFYGGGTQGYSDYPVYEVLEKA